MACITHTCAECGCTWQDNLAVVKNCPDCWSPAVASRFDECVESTKEIIR